MHQLNSTRNLKNVFNIKTLKYKKQLIVLYTCQTYNATKQCTVCYSGKPKTAPINKVPIGSPENISH